VLLLNQKPAKKNLKIDMKVLHVTNNYPTEDHPYYGIFVKEQVESLSCMGINNDIFYINGRENGKYAYIKAVYNLWFILKKEKYDIIHCHHSFSGVVFLLSSVFFRCKCLLSYQNPPEREGGMLLFYICKTLFDGIIVKHKVVDNSKTNIYYLPNGVNINIFKPMDKSLAKSRLGLSDNVRYILFMDSYKLRKQKRLDRFNETLAIIKCKYNIHDVEPLILTGVKRELVPLYVCASDLHIITSDFEGSPNSVKECLACNIPVVSTPVGNVHEMIAGIDGCYVSNTFDAEELAELSFKVLNSESRFNNSSIKSHQLDSISVAKKLSNIYKELLSIR